MKSYILLICMAAAELQAQSLLPAPYLGMGGAAIAQDGLYALLGNPAGLLELQRLEVAICYEQAYFIKDLARQGLLVAVPIGAFNKLGLRLSNYGIAHVSSLLQSGISWTHAFGSTLSMSISLNHHQYYLANYQNNHSYSLDLGMLYRWRAGLAFGFFFKNVAGNAFATSVAEYLPRELGLGLAYSFSESLRFASDLLLSLPGALIYRLGLDYTIHPQFSIRVGSMVNPFQYTAGFGWASRSWFIDIASRFHSKLGTSPQLGIRYVF